MGNIQTNIYFDKMSNNHQEKKDAKRDRLTYPYTGYEKRSRKTTELINITLRLDPSKKLLETY